MARASAQALLREERDGWQRRADKAEAEVVRLREENARLLIELGLAREMVKKLVKSN